MQISACKSIFRSRQVSFPLALLLFVLAAASVRGQQQQASTQPATVRVGIIGGMNDTGFWDALAKRFESETGIHVETVAGGPKDAVAAVFKQGGIDLITMHSSDTIINLVADGYALDPQPWTKNEMVIVGPPEDPAKIKGLTDAAEALHRIAATKSPFVIHSSLGAQEVLRDILNLAGIELEPQTRTVLFEDSARLVLPIAAERHAYTMVGHIPFRTGRLPNAGLVVMVQDDPRLRRPFIVAVANPARFDGVRLELARRLADYLRTPQTQAWIKQFRIPAAGDRPVFFPIDGLVLSSKR